MHWWSPFHTSYCVKGFYPFVMWEYCYILDVVSEREHKWLSRLKQHCFMPTWEFENFFWDDAYIQIFSQHFSFVHKNPIWKLFVTENLSNLVHSNRLLGCYPSIEPYISTYSLPCCILGNSKPMLLEWIGLPIYFNHYAYFVLDHWIEKTAILLWYTIS